MCENPLTNDSARKKRAANKDSLTWYSYAGWYAFLTIVLTVIVRVAIAVMAGYEITFTIGEVFIWAFSAIVATTVLILIRTMWAKGLTEKISTSQAALLALIVITIPIAILEFVLVEQYTPTPPLAGAIGYALSTPIILISLGILLIKRVWIVDPVRRWFEKFRKPLNTETATKKYARGKLTRDQLDQISRAEQLQEEIRRLKLEQESRS